MTVRSDADSLPGPAQTLTFVFERQTGTGQHRRVHFNPEGYVGVLMRRGPSVTVTMHHQYWEGMGSPERISVRVEVRE